MARFVYTFTNSRTGTVITLGSSPTLTKKQEREHGITPETLAEWNIGYSSVDGPPPPPPDRLFPGTFRERYVKSFKNRLAEMRMMHVGLGSGFWHPYDVWYLFTGRA